VRERMGGHVGTGRLHLKKTEGKKRPWRTGVFLRMLSSFMNSLDRMVPTPTPKKSHSGKGVGAATAARTGRRTTPLQRRDRGGLGEGAGTVGGAGGGAAGGFGGALLPPMGKAGCGRRKEGGPILGEKRFGLKQWWKLLCINYFLCILKIETPT